jgi:hypothetical protein
MCLRKIFAKFTPCNRSSCVVSLLRIVFQDHLCIEHPLLVCSSWSTGRAVSLSLKTTNMGVRIPVCPSFHAMHINDLFFLMNILVIFPPHHHCPRSQCLRIHPACACGCDLCS